MDGAFNLFDIYRAHWRQENYPTSELFPPHLFLSLSLSLSSTSMMLGFIRFNVPRCSAYVPAYIDGTQTRYLYTVALTP